MEIYTQEENAASPWWLVLLEGIFVGIFGLLILLAPGATLAFLVQTFGFCLLIVGCLRLVSIFIDSSAWGMKLLAGIIGIILGVVVLRHPLWSTILLPASLVIVVGFLAIFQGVASLIHAFKGGGWGVGILGVLIIVLGFILVLNPLIGVAALPFVLGGTMLIGGIVAIVASFRLRSSPAATGA